MEVIFTLIAIFLFSFWTPIAATAIEHISIWEFVFFTEVVGFIFVWSVLKYRAAKSPKTKYTKYSDLTIREKSIFAASGLFRVLAMYCLFTSFSKLSTAAAISIYDAWSIFALYLTPLMFSKDWSNVTLKEVILSLVAVGGIALILWSEFLKLSNIPSLADVDRQLFITLPLASGLFHALAEVIKSGQIKKMHVKDNPFLSIFVVDINFTGFCALFAGLFLGGNYLINDMIFSDYTPQIIGLILAFSIIVTALGRMVLCLAMARATTNIFVLWFILPVLTLFWLWLFDLTDITGEIVLGASMIIVANLLISAKPDSSTAYPAAIVMILLTSIYCFYFPGGVIDDYFEAVATPLIFYVLIVAFLMDRLISRDRKEEIMVVELIQQVEKEGPTDVKKKKTLINQLTAIVKTNDIDQINARYQAVRNAQHECLKDRYNKLDTLFLSRIQGANFGEMMVLSMVGLLVILTAISFRPDSLFGDCFAIVLSSAICFIYFTVLDLIIMRKRFFLSIDKKGDFGMTSDRLSASKLDQVTSIILIIMIILAMVGVMWNTRM